MVAPGRFWCCSREERGKAEAAGARPKAERGSAFIHTCKFSLDRRLAYLTGANPDYLLDRGDENLAVADFAGAGGLRNGFQRTIHHGFGYDDLDLDLGQKIHHVLGAPIQFRVPLLATETLYLRHCQPGHADFGERFSDFVQFERLDNGLNFFTS